MVRNIFIRPDANNIFVWPPICHLKFYNKKHNKSAYLYKMRYHASFSDTREITLIALHLRISCVRHAVVSECRKLNTTGLEFPPPA